MGSGVVCEHYLRIFHRLKLAIGFIVHVYCLSFILKLSMGLNVLFASVCTTIPVSEADNMA